MQDNILITIISPTTYLIILVKTWEKDGMGIAKIPGSSHFSTTKQI